MHSTQPLPDCLHHYFLHKEHHHFPQIHTHTHKLCMDSSLYPSSQWITLESLKRNLNAAQSVTTMRSWKQFLYSVSFGLLDTPDLSTVLFCFLFWTCKTKKSGFVIAVMKLWRVEDTQMWFTAVPSKPICDGKPWLKFIGVTHQEESDLTRWIAHCAHVLHSGSRASHWFVVDFTFQQIAELRDQ